MRIQYETVVSEYLAGMQTQLRSFRPSHGFLETWVHDEDPARSILNMAEAAKLGGEHDLEIAFHPETSAALDPNRLVALLSGTGHVDLVPEQSAFVLRVSFAP